jgi:hypothetical protein
MTERPERLDEFEATYRELVGFVPPRVKARFAASTIHNPDVLLAQERLRNLIMYPDALDQKTVQLVLFGILHSKLSDAAKLHGVAARRAGASCSPVCLRPPWPSFRLRSPQFRSPS